MFFFSGCPKIPENIKNGKRTVINEREVSFQCHQGYFLSTETNNFICRDNGNWNSDDIIPKCIRSKFQTFFYVFKNIKYQFNWEKP